MTENEVPQHLHATRTDRGFAFMAPIEGAYGGEVQAYESSAASGPHLWLKVIAGNGQEVVSHLAAENAWRLADQIRYLVEHHYQGDARPEGDR